MQSFWEEERKNYKEYESIRNDMRASVCVIGGGLTGLTTAYYLSKYTNVVLLERDRICSHTSGGNTGKVTSQHGVFQYFRHLWSFLQIFNRFAGKRICKKIFKGKSEGNRKY